MNLLRNIKWAFRTFKINIKDAIYNSVLTIKTSSYPILAMSEVRDINKPDLYIGNSKYVLDLLKMGIDLKTLDTLRADMNGVACIGFNPTEQKWYGWSHRAMFGFGIGYVAVEGESCTTSGYIDEYIKEHPEKDISVPVGFEVKTLEDAKKVARAFAESVS